MATEEDKKVFDVAKPGETAPDASSRPIIVGHKPRVQDPTVNDKPSDETSPAAVMAAAKSEMRIEPLATATPEAPKEETVDTKVVPEVVAAKETPKKEPVAPKPAEKEAPAEPPKGEASQSTSSDSAVLEALASQAEAKKGKATEAEDTAKQEAITKLIESKQYNVPLHEKGGEKSARVFGWVLGAFLLLAIVAYLTVDAGLLDIGFKLPVDLIK